MRSFFPIFSKLGKIFSLNSKVSRNSTEDRNGVDADEGAEFDKKGLDLKNDPLEDSRLRCMNI